MIEKGRTVAFSGHRRIVPATQPSLFGQGHPAGGNEYRAAIRDRLGAQLERLAGEGYHTFICGMATGFDLMAGQEVCRLITGGSGVELIAAVPFPGQAERFPVQDRETYREVLSMASYVHTVSPRYVKECYHRRNDFLVENSSVLVCFYNGSPGGTAYTVRRAASAGSTIINIY